MKPIIFHVLFAIFFLIIIINPFSIVTRIYLKARELRLIFIRWWANR